MIPSELGCSVNFKITLRFLYSRPRFHTTFPFLVTILTIYGKKNPHCTKYWKTGFLYFPEAVTLRWSAKKVFSRSLQNLQKNTYGGNSFWQRKFHVTGNKWIKRISIFKSFIFNKNKPWHMCFRVNFAKYSRTNFLKNTYERILQENNLG